MSQSILSHQFENGLALVAEPMEWLESAAFTILIPSGCSRDPADKIGLSNLTCDMVQRGCGPRDGRQFVSDLENLGAQFGGSTANVHSSFGGAMPADNLYKVLAIFADLLRNPLLPEEQFEEGRMVCLQEIRALEDDLSQRVISELRRRQYPDPLGRSCYGTVESVSQLTAADVREYVANHYQPQDAILAVAGKFDWDELRDRVGQSFADWKTRDAADMPTTPAERGFHHIPHESNQTHIALSFPSVPFSHADYYQAQGAVGVLSGGMSSRLFTEIREKRGLCYTVYASASSLREQACIVCYAGTTTERAQETLDVLVAELDRLPQGIESEELDRLKVQVRSGLIMQQESSRQRAASIAGDWYYLGRVRTLDEISEKVNNLTVDSINKYMNEHPPGDFCVVTLGEKQLEISGGVS